MSPFLSLEEPHRSMRVRYSVRRAAHRRFVEIEADVLHVSHRRLSVCSGAAEQSLGKDPVFERREAVTRIDVDLVLFVCFDVELRMPVPSDHGSFREVVRALMLHCRYVQVQPPDRHRLTYFTE